MNAQYAYTLSNYIANITLLAIICVPLIGHQRPVRTIFQLIFSGMGLFFACLYAGNLTGVPNPLENAFLTLGFFGAISFFLIGGIFFIFSNNLFAGLIIAFLGAIFLGFFACPIIWLMLIITILCSSIIVCINRNTNVISKIILIAFSFFTFAMTSNLFIKSSTLNYFKFNFTKIILNVHESNTTVNSNAISILTLTGDSGRKQFTSNSIFGKISNLEELTEYSDHCSDLMFNITQELDTHDQILVVKWKIVSCNTNESNFETYINGELLTENPVELFNGSRITIKAKDSYDNAIRLDVYIKMNRGKLEQIDQFTMSH